MRSRVMTGWVAALGLAAMGSCKSSTSPGGSSANGGGGGGSGPTASINIQSYAFAPTPDTVAINTTVTWTNKDTVTHTVTADSASGTWDSGNLANGATFTYKFQVIGKFTYHCNKHPTMLGTVFVQ